MNIEKVEDLCIRAMETWGFEAQVRKMIEEGAELTLELVKLPQGRSSKAKVCEEAVDTFIMAMQMREFVGREEFDAYLEKKMAKVENRISRTNEIREQRDLSAI